MDTIVFILYAVIFVCIWYVFNQYFKDHSKEVRQPIRVNVGQNFKNGRSIFWELTIIKSYLFQTLRI